MNNNLIDLPAISVVISTRNRGERIVATIKSIFLNDYPDFEVIVLDQSVNTATSDALEPFLADSRLHYINNPIKGLGIGHNSAIGQARHELIAITDDDCEVPDNWLHTLAEIFISNSRVGLVFGNVLAIEYDITTGYIPVFERKKSAILKVFRDDLYNGLGIGACLGLRRSSWQAVQGFDEMLGPGSPFGSLEDRDMAIRLLAAGYSIYQTPNFFVLHNGFRSNSELSLLAYTDWLGFGSCFAKYLKCGIFQIIYYFVIQMWYKQALLPSIQILFREQRIGNVTPIYSFWLGFVAGMLGPVDKATLKFKKNPSLATYLLDKLQKIFA